MNSFFDDFLNETGGYEAPQLLNGTNSYPASPLHDPSLSLQFPEVWNLEEPITPLAHEVSVYSEEKKFEKKTSKSSLDNPVKARGKKRQVFRTVTEDEVKKEMRAERNRQFARESRERKRQYIEYLQGQIAQLRQLVDVYKHRLSKYELIEKYTTSFTGHCFHEIEETLKEFKDTQSLEHSARMVELLKSRHQREIDERQQAMEMLTRKLVEVTLPMHARVSLWLNDNNVDCLDIEKMNQLLGCAIPADHLQLLKEHFSKSWPSREHHRKFKQNFIASWGKVRSLVKELVTVQRKLQLELKKITFIVNNKMIVKYDPVVTRAMRCLAPHVMLNPKIANYTEEIIAKVNSEIEKALVKEDNTVCGDYSEPRSIPNVAA